VLVPAGLVVLVALMQMVLRGFHHPFQQSLLLVEDLERTTMVSTEVPGVPVEVLLTTLDPPLEVLELLHKDTQVGVVQLTMELVLEVVLEQLEETLRLIQVLPVESELVLQLLEAQ
jgi:hypothetical protein